MRPSWLNRHWLQLWLILLALLLAAAPLKRHIELQRLSGRIVAKLQYKAEHGYPAPYTGWGDLQGYLWDVNDGGAQGPAIYLINRGYTDPALLRVLLLSEAQRPYDWAYTYPRVRNYDLRSGLIRRCLAAYPDDLKVAWAAGVLDLAAGDTEQAKLQLMRMLPLGPRSGLEDFANDQGVSREHILGRYLAVLALEGRNGAAGKCALDWYSGHWVKRETDDPVTANLYANWLAESGMYSELLTLLSPGSPASKLLSSADMSSFKATALFWTGDLTAFRQFHPVKLIGIDVMRKSLLNTGPPSFSGLPDDQQMRACGDIYAVTRDVRWVKPLVDHYQRLRKLAELPPNATESDRSIGREASGRLLPAGMQLARAYVLTGRWRDAETVLAAVIAATDEYSVDDPTLLTQLFLCRIALGQPLTEPVTQREAPDWAKDDPNWVNGYYLPNGGETPGPFADLREGDRLAALMRSPQFHAAAKAGGRGPETDKWWGLTAEVNAATCPERDNYYDYSNGELRKGAL